MPTLRRQLEVSRPLDEVWNFVGDFVNSARWDPGVAEATNTTKGPVRVGTVYDLIVVFDGKRSPMTYEVIEYDPPAKVVLKGEGKSVSAVDDIRFGATEGGGTRIDYVADLRLKGLAKLASPFMMGKFENLGDAAIAGMRAKLEADA